MEAATRELIQTRSTVRSRGRPSRLKAEQGGAGWRARLPGPRWSGSCNSGSRSARRQTAPLTDPERLHVRRFLPTDSPGGVCSRSQTPPGGPGFGGTHLSTASAPLRLSPAGLRERCPSPASSTQQGEGASRKNSPKQKQKQQHPATFFLEARPTSLWTRRGLGFEGRVSA